VVAADDGGEGRDDDDDAVGDERVSVDDDNVTGAEEDEVGTTDADGIDTSAPCDDEDEDAGVDAAEACAVCASAFGAANAVAASTSTFCLLHSASCDI
jgi:hypothetical protein